MRRILPFLLLSCTVPYQAASTEVPFPPAAEVEAKIEEVFLHHLPRLDYKQRSPFRLRSAWTDAATPSAALRLRGFLDLVVDPQRRTARVEIVVQRQALRAAPFSLPEWQDAGTERGLEDRIVKEIEDYLAPLRSVSSAQTSK